MQGVHGGKRATTVNYETYANKTSVVFLIWNCGSAQDKKTQSYPSELSSALTGKSVCIDFRWDAQNKLHDLRRQVTGTTIPRSASLLIKTKKLRRQWHLPLWYWMPVRPWHLSPRIPRTVWRWVEIFPNHDQNVTNLCDSLAKMASARNTMLVHLCCIAHCS